METLMLLVNIPSEAHPIAWGAGKNGDEVLHGPQIRESVPNVDIYAQAHIVRRN